MKEGLIFITGASGVIGQALVQACVARGQPVLAGQRNATISVQGDVTVVPYDMNDGTGVQGVLKQYKPEIVVHAAAYGADGKGEPARTIADNVAGFATLVETSLATGVRRMVFLGSAQAYGPKSVPSLEDDDLRPTTTYGLSKKLKADIATFYRMQTHFKICECRLFNVYGGNDKLPRLIPFLMQQAKRNDPIRLGAGSALRDFVHISDAVRIIMSAADGGVSVPVVNVASGIGTRVSEVAEMIVEYSRSQSIILDEQRVASDIFIGNSNLCTQLGLQPQIKLATGLQELVKAHWDRM